MWRFVKSGPSHQNGPLRTSILPSLFTSPTHAPSAQKCGVICCFTHSPVSAGGVVEMPGVFFAGSAAMPMAVSVNREVRMSGVFMCAK